MAVTNRSYLVMSLATDSSTSANELFQHVSARRVRELACQDLPGISPNANPLPQAAIDVIYTALNSATDEINSYLRRVYDVSKTYGLVDTVSATSPSNVIKRLVADFTMFLLERLRMGVLERTEAEQALRRRLISLQKSDAEQILAEDQERSDQVLPRDIRPDAEQGTPFDNIPIYWSPGTTRGTPPRG